MNGREFAPIHTEWDDRAVEKAVDEAIASRSASVRRSSMKLGPYNGFDGSARVLADYKIKVAVYLGLIAKASRFSVCDTTEGRIDVEVHYRWGCRYFETRGVEPGDLALICKFFDTHVFFFVCASLTRTISLFKDSLKNAGPEAACA